MDAAWPLNVTATDITAPNNGVTICAGSVFLNGSAGDFGGALHLASTAIVNAWLVIC